MRLSIIRLLVTCFGLRTYFKRRKVDTRYPYLEIYLSNGRTLVIARKDLVNVILILASSFLITRAAQRCYFYLNNNLNQDKQSLNNLLKYTINTKNDVINSTQSSVIDISTDTIDQQSYTFFKPRRIILIIVMVSVIVYLNQTIDVEATVTDSNDAVIDVASSTVTDSELLPMQTTKLSWWDKIGLDPKLIKDMEDDSGSISRPTIEITNEPVETRPRKRFEIIVGFAINQSKEKIKPKLPSWVFPMMSPAGFVISKLYKFFKK